MPRDDAVAYFKSLGEVYKPRSSTSIPQRKRLVCTGRETGSTCAAARTCRYRQAQPSSSRRWPAPIGAEIRATRCSSAFYGTAWAEQETADEYLHRIEEAEKADHRRIGRELDLFHMQEEAPGAVFWHPHGWLIFRRSSRTCASATARPVSAK